MKCPIDNTPLQMTERQGVEIDYCPECRGVWLDRGELDKIIDKSESVMRPAPVSDTREYRQDYDRNQPVYGKKRKREGFLSDLFDFGD